MTRQSWPNDRLGERFDHLDAEIATLRTEVRAGNAELRQEIKESATELRKEIASSVTELRAEMQAGDAGLHAAIASINRTLLNAALSLIGAIVVAILVHFL